MPDQKNGDPVPDADRVVPTATSLRLGGDITRRPEEQTNFVPHRPTRIVYELVSCIYRLC
jgi:hypothetical protein